jgi:ABC-type Na+ efflux pump permease subunit
MYILLAPNNMVQHNTSAIGSETEKRFRFFLTAFRVSGVPLLFNEIPKFFNLYAAAAIFFCYATFVSLLADFFINTEDLEHTMETSRALFPAVMIIWMHIFIR